MVAIDILKKQRTLIHKAISAMPEELLFAIPAVRKNNIAWNLGHIVTIQQTITYGLCKQTPRIPEFYRAWYFRDTSPANWDGQPNIPQLLQDLQELPALFEQDLREGKLTGFEPYTTVTGIHLATLEEAIGFNNFHEGIHFGIIMAIRKELEVAG